MNRLLVVAALSLFACQPRARRVVHGPSTPKVPTCTVTIPALRVTDVTCQGDFSRDELWSVSLNRAAETGPDHASFSFEVTETNENKGWRALRARFAGPQEPMAQYVIDRLLTPDQLDAARTRATKAACQRAVIEQTTDAATRASCLQFLTAQQEIAQKERHHAAEVGVQRQAVEVQRQQAVAQQQAADALMLQTLQRSQRGNVVIVGEAGCRSSLDCGGGSFCKDWRGSRVCMGHGLAGSPCSSSIDCGGGLFCRGDVCG